LSGVGVWVSGVDIARGGSLVLGIAKVADRGVCLFACYYDVPPHVHSYTHHYLCINGVRLTLW